MEKKITLYDKRETFLQSFTNDLTTLGFVLICIWASQGSQWWTFFTAILALIFVAAKISMASESRKTVFKTLDEFEQWVKQERAKEQQAINN